MRVFLLILGRWYLYAFGTRECQKVSKLNFQTNHNKQRYMFDMFGKSILIYTDIDLYVLPMCLHDVLIGCVVMCYVCIYGHGYMYV